MKKKKNIVAKVFAFLALFWIIIWIIWTWILFVVQSWSSKKTISKEELQKLIKENKIKITTNSWITN